jgi:hypothetical protein
VPRGDSGLWLIKTDSLGDVKWERTYGIRYGMLRDNLLIPVQLTPDGGYIIGTRALLKVDSLRNVEWYQTTPRVAMTRSVLVASDGGYVGTGFEFYSKSEWGGGPMSIMLYKTDHAGNLLWSRDIGGQASRGGYSVVQTTDGGFVVAATTEESIVIRTDSLGSPVWSKTFGAGAGIDCVRQTTDGGFVVAGSDWSGGEGTRMSLWKLGPEGQ